MKFLSSWRRGQGPKVLRTNSIESQNGKRAGVVVGKIESLIDRAERLTLELNARDLGTTVAIERLKMEQRSHRERPDPQEISERLDACHPAWVTPAYAATGRRWRVIGGGVPVLVDPDR